MNFILPSLDGYWPSGISQHRLIGLLNWLLNRAAKYEVLKIGMRKNYKIKRRNKLIQLSSFCFVLTGSHVLQDGLKLGTSLRMTLT